MACKHQQKKIRFTKIVATVNGKTCDRAQIQALFDAGMNVMRMNSAHMSLEEMERLIADARAVSPYLAVMLDTKGPNIRTCNLSDEGLPIAPGETVRISGEPGGDGRIQVNYASFTAEVPVGSRIVCDDGAAAFKVTGKADGCLLAEVIAGTVVKNRKSVNVPDVPLKAPALTAKDRLFLARAAELKCDLIAHSFVRSAEDIREVRQALGEAGKDIGIIAKIENREGVDNISEILNAADGIMVARGDLGIEIPLEEVPAIQKHLIYLARMAAKPVITATQMLQSMENSPLPTRAEVSDVANAVYDGTDAIMLSGETANGRFPLESVRMMDRIAMEAENAPGYCFTELKAAPQITGESSYIMTAAVHAAKALPIYGIVCSSISGMSARFCSALRPMVPIFVPTPREITMRKLALSFGVLSAMTAYEEVPVLQVFQSLQKLKELWEDARGDELLVILGQNSTEVKGNNFFCLSTLDNALNAIRE